MFERRVQRSHEWVHSSQDDDEELYTGLSGGGSGNVDDSTTRVDDETTERQCRQHLLSDEIDMKLVCDPRRVWSIEDIIDNDEERTRLIEESEQQRIKLSEIAHSLQKQQNITDSEKV